MKLFKNREFRLLMYIVTLLLLSFGAVNLYLFRNFAREVNQAQIRQNIGAIGTLVREYPRLENDIVKNYIRAPGEQDFQTGKSILKKYSYGENLEIYKNETVYSSLKSVEARIAILIGAFMIVCILLLLLSWGKMYQRIRKIGECAEAVVEGSYEPMEGDKNEGDFGFLIHQFNSMTGRLSENVNALKDEKLFLKKLVTDISHQLKTPMASLIMFNDLLINDENLSAEERTLFVEQSRNQLLRMEWLVKNLLKMAKLEAGVVQFEKREEKVIGTVQRSILGLRHLADAKDVRISVSGDEDITVRHDAGWTTEALSNIIKNSLEHSPEKGEIQINLSRNNIFIEIEIKDFGIGIPPSELPKIFDRFYKGVNSQSPTNIGVGLYIAKTIIEGQGGSIYVHSREGQETKFIVRLMKTA